MTAVVKSHIYKDEMVHAVYSDVVETLTEPVAMADVIAGIEVESGESVPDVKELRSFRTSAKKILFGADAGKLAVRAVLRYVPVTE